MIDTDENEGALLRATWVSVTVHLPIWPLVIPIFLKSEGQTDRLTDRHSNTISEVHF